MRLKVLVILTVLLVFAWPYASAAAEFSLTVNGLPLAPDVRPVLEGRNVLLPLRFVAEALGAAVIYDEVLETVQVSKPGLEVLITPGEYSGVKNGNTILFTTPPKIINDRTYVTREELAELLNIRIFLNMPLYSVTIEG